jgi:hypothetical protein
MSISIDEALDRFVKNSEGNSKIVTGWVVLVSVVDGTVGGAPAGFTMVNSESMAEHVKLGLLESATQLIKSEILFQRFDRPDSPPNDSLPF